MPINQGGTSGRFKPGEPLTSAASASVDPLTGLATRAAILQWLDARLTQVERPAVAVLFLDLDGFKRVNDTYGHAYGDRLLVEVARRIAEAVSPADRVGRLGGDEFLVVCDLDRDRDATDIARAVARSVQRRVTLDGVGLRPRVSIGVAEADAATAVTASSLVADADHVMYAAKCSGSGVEIADEHSRTALQRAVAVAADLGPALASGDVQFDYQPIMCIDTNELLGCEALIRWEHPTFGPIPPPMLVEQAEATGQINDLTRWSLETIGRQWSDLRNRWPLFRDKAVAINLGAPQLCRSDYAGLHMAMLQRFSLRPEDIIIEIVESRIIDADDQAEHTLGELADRGVILALDDFGAGYNSLTYFSRWPIRAIKVDRSLIWAATADEATRTILRGVVKMAAELDVGLVAEGIETEEQLGLCRDLGFQKAQGFLLCPPLPLERLEATQAASWTEVQLSKRAMGTLPT